MSGRIAHLNQGGKLSMRVIRDLPPRRSSYDGHVCTVRVHAASRHSSETLSLVRYLDGASVGPGEPFPWDSTSRRAKWLTTVALLRAAST
jgi:hypothetical protein